MDLQEIKLAGIAGDSIVDGPGIRITLFAQGCPRCCPGCHNPETQSFEGGTGYTTRQLFEMIKRNPLAGGVTFSGGEPFAQAAGFAQLAGRLAQDGYELAAYSGYTFEQLLAGEDSQRQLLELLDILVDGEYLQEQRNLDLRWRGSENQRIIDVPESLKQGRAVLSTDPRWV